MELIEFRELALAQFAWRMVQVRASRVRGKGGVAFHW
jgi:hypothetical protein